MRTTTTTARTRTPRSFVSKASHAIMACALATLCMPLAGCASSPENEAVQLLVKVPRTSHHVVFDDSITQIDQAIEIMADSFEADYEGQPVEIEVEVFEQTQYDDAIPGHFDTDKAADVLYGDYFNMSGYIHSGRVVPLDDIISDEVRESVYDYLWKMSYMDGHTYMAPYLARQNVLAYNKELFRQAGLDDLIADGVIQSWSLDEWTRVLDTLAAELPEGTYPMMMYAGSSQGDTHIMTLLRSAGSAFFDEDGHFNLSTPEGIAALSWIQEGVARGWFPPHCENLEIEDCSSLFREGQLAIYMLNNASIGRYGDTVGLVNFPGGENGCATSFVSGFEVFDNGDPEKLQIAKDFIAYIYDHEDLMAYAAGTIPASKAISERYRDDILGFDMFLANSGNVVDFTGGNPDTHLIREDFYQVMHELLMGNVTPEEAAAMIDEQCNAAIDESIAESILHD